MIRTIGILGLLALGLGIAWPRSTGDRRPETRDPSQDYKRPHVEVARPQRKAIHRRLKVAGEARPNQEAGIYARVQGYVESVPVDRGSWVKQGDVLARIAVPEIERMIDKERAELALCEPSLRKATAERDWRKAVWERLDRISKRTPDLINAELLDDASGRYATAEAEVALTKARERTFEAAVAKTQAMLDFATLRAPFDGVITERWVDPGALTQVGTTKLLHLVQADVVRVRVHVPQSDVVSVREESTAEVSVDELPGRTFQAKVGRLFWGLARETKTMAVEFDIRNEGADRTAWVRPGMFARVAMNLDPRPNVLVLPASALVVEKKKTFVFVATDGVAKRVAVDVGMDNGVEFEAKSGVAETDEVVVAGKNLVSDNDKVRVTRREPK
jgi:RND family efflux transporter MFP subunit